MDRGEKSQGLPITWGATVGKRLGLCTVSSLIKSKVMTSLPNSKFYDGKMKVTCENVLRELTPCKDQLFLLLEKPYERHLGGSVR